MKNMDISQLVELGYQYGPFFFSILYVVFVSRWAYAKYKENMRAINPPTAERDIATVRAIFVASFTIGVVLVAFSVWWWWAYRPQTYLFRGEIRDLQDYEQLASEGMYFRVEPKATIDGVSLRNEHFALIQVAPFRKGQVFEVEFSKDKSKRNRFPVLYDPSDPYPTFRVEWDENLKTNVLRKDNSLQTLENIFPKLQVSVYARNWNQAEMGRQDKVGRKRDPFVGNNDTALAISILRDPKADVGTKIATLDQLLAKDDKILATLLAQTNSLDAWIDIIDLTRHSDKELAYKTESLVTRVHLDDYLAAQLQSKDSGLRTGAEKLFFKLPQDDAESVLRMLPNTQASVLRAKTVSVRNAAQVVPTASPQGELYFVKATWDPNNRGALDCLTQLFNKELINNRSLEQEKELMKARHERYVYWNEKGWSIYIYDEIEKCGGSASFVRSPALK